jgi:hypothetical protein
VGKALAVALSQMPRNSCMASPTSISWRITAHDEGELFSQFGAFGIRVSGRTEPKDQFAEEMYCLRRFLFHLLLENIGITILE